MASRKRRRSGFDDESGSDSNDEDEYVPEKKRPRRGGFFNSKASKKVTQASEEDVDSGEDKEAAWFQLKAKCTKLTKENTALKKRVQSLRAEIKTLKAPAAAEVDGKKLCTQFKKALIRIAKLKKTVFYGDGTIDVEQTMDIGVLSALFEGKGDKIQPTPDNKPRSVKTIIRFADWDAVQAFFSDWGVDLPREIDVSLWRQGSLRRGKSCYIGKTKGNIDSLDVEHNKTSSKLTLKFDVSQNYADY